MKSVFIFTLICLLIQFTARSQDRDIFYLCGTKLVNDSAHISLTVTAKIDGKETISSRVTDLLKEKKTTKLALCTTKKGQEVALYFFPGTSDKKALVIGGMHGSELSSIEVAKTLVGQLNNSELPFYNVLVIPALFPDNALEALKEKGDRTFLNTGRFTNEETADPNRQMPLPGTPFLPHQPLDALHRKVEEENQALLQLIQAYLPDRLLNIHAIGNRSKAGIFADPRTDCAGYALGFESDKALALLMAQHIKNLGGNCPGNSLQSRSTAIYYLDPPAAEKGQKQPRSRQGSNMASRGRGVSLGTWCSTAVCHDNEAWSRRAIRTFTMEFPGYRIPAEYKDPKDQRLYAHMLATYAGAIQHYFLQECYEEDESRLAK